jgi:pyridoxal phosphate enzyme (YggS family)
MPAPIPMTAMSDLKNRIQRIQEEIRQTCIRVGRSPESVRLIVVTKTQSAESVRQVIDAGIVDIGENRVQEILDKAPYLTGRFSLHLIGHLQSNKVAKVVGMVDWIHSVDSERVFRKIEQCCMASQRRVNLLVQVNTSGEESKFGCAADAAHNLCRLVADSPHVRFRGLMTIGPLLGGEPAARKSFVMLRELAAKVSGSAALELSMGMSADFRWAIEEGATMVRIGSLILGERH